MVMKEIDVRARVVQYFAASRQLIEERGWSEFFTDEKVNEIRCKLLVNYIEPAMLRGGVKDAMELKKHVTLSDENELFRLVLRRVLVRFRDDGVESSLMETA